MLVDGVGKRILPSSLGHERLAAGMPDELDIRVGIAGKLEFVVVAIRPHAVEVCALGVGKEVNSGPNTCCYDKGVIVKRVKLLLGPAQGINKGGRKSGLETEGGPACPNRHSEVVLVNISDKKVSNDTLSPIPEEPSVVHNRDKAFFQVVKGVGQGELAKIVQFIIVDRRTGGLDGRKGGRGTDRGCFRHFFFLQRFFFGKVAYENILVIPL